jgi:hypothetical protein
MAQWWRCLLKKPKSERYRNAPKRVAIAAINGKQHFVLSGRTQAVEAVVAILHSQRIKTKPLIVSRGFHSRQMEPMLAEYAEILKTVSFASPHTDIVSNLTGKLATADIITQPIGVGIFEKRTICGGDGDSSPAGLRYLYRNWLASNLARHGHSLSAQSNRWLAPQFA